MLNPLAIESPSIWRPAELNSLDEAEQNVACGGDCPQGVLDHPCCSRSSSTLGPIPWPPAHTSEDEAQVKRRASEDDFIQAADFPMPPTLTGAVHTPYRYPCPPSLAEPPSPIFTPITASPIPSGANINNNKNRHLTPNDQASTCYFETLDFSDYDHSHNRGAKDINIDIDNNLNDREAYRNNPNYLFRQYISHREQHGHEHHYRPRSTRSGLLPTLNPAMSFPSHLRGKEGYGTISFGSTVMDAVAAGVGQSPLDEDQESRVKQGWRRAAREAVVVVCVVSLVTGLLAGMGWGVKRGFEMWVGAMGEGKLDIADVSGHGGGGGGEWPVCSEARPRFCRIIVGERR